MQHDEKLDVATGRSRKETNWKNKTLFWSAVVAKLSTTHRTPETIAEYLAAKPARQAEIKDIGGFVGGHLSGGRRKAGSVLTRQIVTLDADFNPSSLWDDWLLLYGCAACVYSTHKHTAEAPRLRLVVPLSRPVEPVEYMAIARRIAGTLGIDQFDPTTYQVERLMYWPSTAKDGEYYFETIDAPFIDADALLATYHDFRDSSEWPTSDKEGEVVTRAIKKQGDPLEKVGLVGTFCRTYTIHEAIDTFLSDIYTPTDVDDRYSYSLGSTAGGLITYDDKFAYSHHGTDPISGKLCNAFDLVRIHKFGLQDEDADPKTVTTKLPSFRAMADFAAGLPEVRQVIGEELLQAAKVDFGDDTEEGKVAETLDVSWMRELEASKQNEYLSTINNFVLILENDYALKDSIAFDEFEQRPIFRKKMPWRKVTFQTRFVTDMDAADIERHIETIYKIKGEQKLDKALLCVFQKTRFHPVRDYLNGLKWDGKPRVDDLFIRYMGVKDNDYTRAVSRKALVAAVARVFEPGCKFDYVLTLIGTTQGQGKSMLLRKLGNGWFSDTFNFHMIQNNRGYEAIAGVWLVEIAEMGGITKTEIEAVKGFISSQKDRYRSAYGKRVEDHYRQCVFFGTTNKPDFLRDQTGNRRFWPLLVDTDNAVESVKDMTGAEVGQVWAEALTYYREGETLYLSDDLEKMAGKVQDRHTEAHPWAAVIEDYLEKEIPENWYKLSYWERVAILNGEDEKDDAEPVISMQRTRVCISEIYREALGERGVPDERAAVTIRNILRKLTDWEEVDKALHFGLYGRQRRGFVRKN